MTTKAITEQQDRPPDWKAPNEEQAPSVMAQDEPTVARFLGMVGAALLIFGGTILLLQMAGFRSALGSGWIILSLAGGIAFLLFHASYDRDIQFRRMYLGFGGFVLAVGTLLCLWQWLQHSFAGGPEGLRDLFTPGVGLLLLAGLFLLAPLRYEDDADIRKITTLVLGGTGLAFALVGFGIGLLKPELLAPYGVVLPLVGLFYLIAFVGSRGTSDDLAYNTGWGIGLGGLALFLIALGRSVYPSLANALFTNPTPVREYLAPFGLILMLFGLLYMLASVLLTSDSVLVVLIRRELGAFFYSPIVHIVLFAFAFAYWMTYYFHVVQLLPAVDFQTGTRHFQPEPIVRGFVFEVFVFICNLFAVPALTMRLLSEEQRSGTLEVLLTAPVGEGQVVLSKFLAGLMLYLITWVPLGVLLIIFRVMSGTDFDYRPLLSFAVALVATGASFVAIGLLFSSLTRDQIASGVLTFVAMLALTLVYVLVFFVTRSNTRAMEGSGTFWGPVLTHMSYLHLWDEALQGKLVLRYLVFPISLTIFCLFLTTRILEARKWK